MQSYAELRDNFVWDIPEYYNIGYDVCDKWAEQDPDRRALTIVNNDETSKNISFGQLKAFSNRIANMLVAEGRERGDRIGVLLPQMLETAASHIAIYKMGAIAVPLFVLFGPDALQHRIVDGGISTIITNRSGAAKLRSMDQSVHEKLNIHIVESEEFQALIENNSDQFDICNTKAEDPAIIIYTSGTTGTPKGALHAHRVLLGHLPGMEMSHDFFPKPGDVIWTPADWAWIGGLLDVLLPALHHGIPVIARRFEKFTAEAAYALLSRHHVTNAFLPPTALKMMRSTTHDIDKFPLHLRTVGSGGETLGAELLDWGREVLGVTINEFYGQTECNLIISSCSALMPPRPGITGRVVPGHELAIIDAKGAIAPQGTIGQIAVKKGDPVMFLEYWNNPQATQEKFIGDWLLTGDTGIDEGNGWIRFVGRDDDVITSSGYRIGPGEIEDCLLKHPAVKLAAVIGKPDKTRTEIVKAYIVLQENFDPSDALKSEIQSHVKSQLAAYEYPRDIEFLSDIPVTTTGKIMRRVLRDRTVQEGQS